MVCYGAELKLESPSEDAFQKKYEYRQSWGETLSDRIDPRIFCLDLRTLKIEMLPCPDGFSPSSPSILPNGDIAFVGYASAPTKLGLFFCYNRPSQLFLWKRQANEVVSIYSDTGFAVRSLRYSNGRLYFLRSRVGGSHFAPSDLCYLEVNAPAGVVLLAEQIFAEEISIDDPEHLVYFDEPSRSLRQYRIIDGATGELWVAEGETPGEHSESILDLCGGWALIRSSSPTSPPTLWLRRVRDKSRFKMEIKYRDLPPSLGSIAKASFKVFCLSKVAEYVLLEPSQANGSLIVFIHGGPNSVYSTEWNLYSASFMALGYTVVTVNYAGSIGFGQEGVDALEGHIGERDLADVVSTIDKLEEHMGKFRKIVLFGGSHGGYISTMLSGRHPDRFSACIVRNPVVDLPSMSYATDILDWTFGQMGLPFLLSRPLPADKDQLVQLHQHSPSSYVKHVRAPTLILIGEKDLRVPPFQGKIWHTWLKARGVPTKLLAFPDAGHSLDSAAAEKGSLLAIRDFLAGLE